MKLAHTVKASHYTALRCSRVKIPTRLFKVCLRGLLIIERGKKPVRIQGLLAHGLIERVASEINSDLYDELSLDSKYKNKETIT